MPYRLECSEADSAWQPFDPDEVFPTLDAAEDALRRDGCLVVPSGAQFKHGRKPRFYKVKGSRVYQRHSQGGWEPVNADGFQELFSRPYTVDQFDYWSPSPGVLLSYDIHNGAFASWDWTSDGSLFVRLQRGKRRTAKPKEVYRLLDDSLVIWSLRKETEWVSTRTPDDWEIRIKEVT